LGPKKKSQHKKKNVVREISQDTETEEIVNRRIESSEKKEKWENEKRQKGLMDRLGGKNPRKMESTGTSCDLEGTG